MWLLNALLMGSNFIVVMGLTITSTRTLKRALKRVKILKRHDVFECVFLFLKKRIEIEVTIMKTKT